MISTFFGFAFCGFTSYQNREDKDCESEPNLWKYTLGLTIFALYSGIAHPGVTFGVVSCFDAECRKKKSSKLMLLSIIAVPNLASIFLGGFYLNHFVGVEKCANALKHSIYVAGILSITTGIFLTSFCIAGAIYADTVFKKIKITYYDNINGTKTESRWEDDEEVTTPLIPPKIT